jgi:hypothetical protein
VLGYPVGLGHEAVVIEESVENVVLIRPFKRFSSISDFPAFQLMFH